jgi:hypothetical protein
MVSGINFKKRMSKRKQYLFFPGAALLMMLVTLVFTMEGCKKDRCLKSTGSIIKEERQLGDFGKIILTDNINLYITQDSINRAEVEAGANLIPYIKTEVENRVLTVRDDNTCNWMRSYKKKINVYLHCRELFLLEYRGGGNVSGTNTIVSDTLELDFWDGSGSVTLDVNCRTVRMHLHTGPGDAFISGTTQNAYYYTRGNGLIRCDKLKSGYTLVDAAGTNDSYVHSSGMLIASIGYIGNVYYSGNPGLILPQINERGQLIPLE